MTSLVSRNYARALFELAVEAGTRDRVEEELRAVRDVLCVDPVVRDFLGNRLIGRTPKKAVIRSSFGAEIDPQVLTFLFLLADRGRVGLLPEIVEEYERLARLARGVRRVRVATPFPLDAAQVGRVVRSLEARFGVRVELETEIRPSLIGGVVAESEGKEIELSLEGGLRDLRTAVAKGDER